VTQDTKTDRATVVGIERGLDKHPRPEPDWLCPAPGAVVPAAAAAPATNVFTRPCTLGSNGDEDRFGETFIGNFHKGLKHDARGLVIPADYRRLRDEVLAVGEGHPEVFENIPLAGKRKMTNPQAGLAKDTEGPTPKDLRICAAPQLDSAEEASEAVELYWMALLRDVPFGQFNTDPMIARAAAELSGLVDFFGPRDASGQVTPDTIFRGNTPGDLRGPFVSQFLLLDVPYGALRIGQQQKTVTPSIDYLTDFGTWRAVQDGSTSVPQDDFDPTRRHIRSMRDLGQYVHVDALYEAYLNACLILLGMNAPVDEGNPYKENPLDPTQDKSKTQIGFGTFGGPHVLSLVCEAATRALKAVWYQKWFVHRRLRPEAFGGLVHIVKTGLASPGEIPLHDQVVGSKAVEETKKRQGTFLMPMAFPEGSPTHPAYGAGHATVAGACVTVLKAWFDEDAIVPNPKRPSDDGTQLDDFVGPPLRIGDELNKVAANIACGRNMAGVHWRTDYIESVKLGERVAMVILKNQGNDYNEVFSLSFTRFNGQKVKVIPGKIVDAATDTEINPLTD
jgi:hypothetical protein